MALDKVTSSNFRSTTAAGNRIVRAQQFNDMVSTLKGETGPTALTLKRSIKVLAPVADTELTTLTLSANESGSLCLIAPITDALTIVLPPTAGNSGVYFTFVVLPQGEATGDATVMTPDEKLIVGSLTFGGGLGGDASVLTADGESGTIFFSGSGGGLATGDTITVTCMDGTHWFVSAGLTAGTGSIVFSGE